MNHIKTIIIIIGISFLFTTTVIADAPVERYHISYEDISKDVLKNSIGILTINSDPKIGNFFKTYVRSDKQFLFDKTIIIHEETLPISNYGYQPRDGKYISNYRYPIVAKLDEYVCIVYESKKNLEAWIKLNEFQENSHTDIVLFDSLETPTPYYVDIFSFTENGKRYLHKKPENNSESMVISKDDPNPDYSLVKIIEQKDGFAKIGIFTYNYNSYEENIKPFGWIKIKDDNGMLSIWIYNVDHC